MNFPRRQAENAGESAEVGLSNPQNNNQKKLSIMKNYYAIIFESNSNGEKRITLGNYYFTNYKKAKQYAKKFVENSIVKVKYDILIILPYNK